VQNTRLSRLVDSSIDRFGGWLQNPWRRISLVILSLLFGNFLATAISTTAGQRAEWDVMAGVILVTVTELVNWLYYRRWRRQTLVEETRVRSLVAEILHGTKVGLVYGLFLEAFKLGS
jgi:hypothetical protein